jgi:hypothetical protein
MLGHVPLTNGTMKIASFLRPFILFGMPWNNTTPGHPFPADEILADWACFGRILAPRIAATGCWLAWLLLQ